MRNIDPVSIQLFLAALEEGSIARAAARENIVPSAVSKRISEMEIIFGVPLLERGIKGVTATPAGAALSQHARLLLQGMERMQREMAAYAGGVRGLIRVTASVTSLSGDLPADIQDFHRSHPQIQIELEEKMTPAIFRSVQEGTSDIGIASEFGSLEGLEIFPYRSYELAAVVPVHHPLAAQPSLSFAELLPYDQIELNRDSGIAAMFDQAARELRQSRRTSARVNSHETICKLVGRGMGVGIVPHYLKEHQERASAIRFIALTEAWSRPRICMAVRNFQALPSAAQAFVAHLRLRAEGEQLLNRWGIPG
jgi:DNA-binding transcriptional LysR family regulator